MYGYGNDVCLRLIPFRLVLILRLKSIELVHVSGYMTQEKCRRRRNAVTYFASLCHGRSHFEGLLRWLENE